LLRYRLRLKELRARRGYFGSGARGVGAGAKFVLHQHSYCLVEDLPAM
jgi:hypothetical protein